MKSRSSSKAKTVLSAEVRLHRNEASVRAVKNGEENRFSACLRALENVSLALGDPIAVVGGLAAIDHGAEVTTLDVDVAVSAGMLERILTVAPQFGFEVKTNSPNGWHQLLFAHPDGDVDVHVVPEGAKSPRDPESAPPNPGPRDLGVTSGLGYAAFAPWVVMKLVTGRDKDRYHLVEVLKHATEAAVGEVVQRLRELDPSYLAEFERLVRASAEESSHDVW